MKRVFVMAVAAALMLSGLVGCGKQETQLPSAAPTSIANQEASDVSAPSAASAPTGGQEQPAAAPAIDSGLETFISLPAQGYPLDMVRLSDGRLRVSLMNEDEKYQVFTQDASGSWTEDVKLPDVIWDLGYKDQLRLSPDGSVFISTLEDLGNGSYTNHFLLYTADGELQELPIDYAEAGTDGFFLGGVDFTDSGKLMVLFNFNDLREVDLYDGSLSENLNAQSAELATANMGCAGENTYLYSAMGDGKCTLVRDGQQTDLSGPMAEKLSASVLVTAGAAVKNVFWLDTDGTLYFTTNEGLFRIAQGSDNAEQLVSGADSSFGDSLFIPLAMTGGENGSVYVLADLSNQTVLCKFNTNH